MIFFARKFSKISHIFLRPPPQNQNSAGRPPRGLFALMMQLPSTLSSLSTISETFCLILSIILETFRIFAEKLQLWSNERCNRKYYFIDNGLITLFKDEMHGELLENVVAVNLRKIAGDRVYYFKHNIEVDFFIPDSRTAVQVCYSVNNEATLSREFAAFDALGARYPLVRCLLITFDDERELTTAGGLHVSVIPVWKWLLTFED